MLKYVELYLQIRSSYPDLNYDQAIVESFIAGYITFELASELLTLYDEVVRG